MVVAVRKLVVSMLFVDCLLLIGNILFVVLALIFDQIVVVRRLLMLLISVIDKLLDVGTKLVDSFILDVGMVSDISKLWLCATGTVPIETVEDNIVNNVGVVCIEETGRVDKSDEEINMIEGELCGVGKLNIDDDCDLEVFGV